MRRNVMICTAATLTAIAALGGITAGSASAATGAPTMLTGSPNAAIAVSASPPTSVATGAGPARVCAIIADPTSALSSEEAATAVPAPALSGAAKAVALSRACPDGVCVTVVPVPAPRYLKGVVHAPTGSARRAVAVHCAGAKGGAGPAEIKPLTSAVTCPVPGVAAPAK